jgi:hypothetical protein
MKKNILFFLFLMPVLILCKDVDSSFGSTELFPKGIHFRPLFANQQEARFGVLYFTDNSNLKVDIGNSIDLVSIAFPSCNSRLTFGADFFAYAYSTSFKGNRLQIDALDGFFGGNAVFSKKIENDRFITRFRIIHNSAHLVDGHFDQSIDKWIDNKKPIPFTKDFGELLFVHEKFINSVLLKYYGGVSYSTLIRPSDMKKYAFIVGTEISLLNALGKLTDKDNNLFIAYNFNLVGIPAYVGNNNIMLGNKFGAWYDKGLVIYINYYSGQNMLSEYYENKINKFGAGFLIDF